MISQVCTQLFTCQTYHNKVVLKNRNESKIKAFPNYKKKKKTKQNTSGNVLVELAYKKKTKGSPSGCNK